MNGDKQALATGRSGIWKNFLFYMRKVPDLRRYDAKVVRTNSYIPESQSRTKEFLCQAPEIGYREPDRSHSVPCQEKANLF